MLERKTRLHFFHSRSQLGEDRVGADNIKLICEKRWIGAKIGIGKANVFCLIQFWIQLLCIYHLLSNTVYIKMHL